MGSPFTASDVGAGRRAVLERNPDLFLSQIICSLIHLCLYFSLWRHGFPWRRQRRLSGCIASCPLTMNPTLLHSLVPSFSPHSLSLSVLRLNLSFSDGKMRRSGVSGEIFLASWVKRINVEWSSRADLRQKDMTLDLWPEL